MRQFILAAAMAVLAVTSANAAQQCFRFTENFCLEENTPKKWELLFVDNFNTSPLDRWSTTLNMWEDRNLPNAKEEQWYIDPAYQGLGINPFSVDRGILTITANKAPSMLVPLKDGSVVPNIKYTSGALTSRQAFSTIGGKIEFRARLPKGKGLWPALWLLPTDGDWPPEIDVFEVLGHEPTTLHTSLHSKKQELVHKGHVVPDLSADFHTFGVEWDDTTILWYFDGEQIFSSPTPADLVQRRLYVLITLGVGGTWPGSPDETTTFPAKMEIDYIRVYKPAVD